MENTENETATEWSDDDFYCTLEANKSGHQDSSDNTGDDVPLARLVRRIKRKPVKRKLLDNDTDSDDHDTTTTFAPSKEDMNPSDSEHDENLKLDKKTAKKRKIKRDRIKGWKKKPTRITARSVSNTKISSKTDTAKKLQNLLKILKEHRKRTTGSELEQAKKISKRQESVREFVRRSHTERLDAMLASNELKRVSIYGDGNCIFSAIKRSCNIEENIDNIRIGVCELMKEQAGKNAPFCAGSSNVQQFLEKLEMLKGSGTWDLDIVDVVPMALSNKYQSNIRIYSSSISTPVIYINSDQQTENRITLAYIAIRGHEHYDAVDKIDADVDSPSLLNDQDEEPKEQAGTTVQTTPHKRASYRSPQKKPSNRKRKRAPDTWGRNIRKVKRSKGMEYTSTTGKTVRAKQVQPQNCSKCRFKCSENFTEVQRHSVFDFYYSLESYERQRQYICEMIDKQEPVRKGKNIKSSSKIKRVRVCRCFFLNTLDIKRKTVEYVLGKKEHGSYGSKDMRGRCSSANKLKISLVDGVKKHIESFPKMESHYARQQSKKEYLALELNITKMWQLYKTECEKKRFEYVKQSKYRKIFCESYNLSFYKLKKDQCSLCTLYERKRAANSLDKNLLQQYDEHQMKKTQARNEKDQDKLRAKSDKSVYVATFDLQAVLTTPCTLVSELYYSQKLCCYNLTIYSLGDKKVVCHVWDESQAKRGSCEIATCLLKNTLCLQEPPVG